MPPNPLQIPRNQLPRLLQRNPGAKSTELATRAQVSTPTMVRMLKEAGNTVLRLGKARGTRYFLRRTLRGTTTGAPVYAIDRDGVPTLVGQLDLITPRGTVLDVAGMGWPIEQEFAQDLWLHNKAAPQSVLSEHDTPAGYLAFAEQASSRGVAGSSAGGEFPKFPALRELPGAQTPHVIVKFSADDRSDTVQRWSDLLVCEHLAHLTIRTIPGIQSANSRMLQHGGRTFLEVERFDRHGLFGRSPLCCLDTLEAALMPTTSTDWGDAGDAMHALGWISLAAAAQLRTIWAFGKLIANADMHKGNVSFVPGPNMQVAPVYDMLPMAYAPMAGGEVPRAEYTPGLPTPKDRAAWLLASQAAQLFWDTARADPRISARFREVCGANLQELNRLITLA